MIQELEKGAVRAFVDEAVHCVSGTGTVDGWAQKRYKLRW